MNVGAVANTWGISGPDFLGAYGALCAVAAGVVAWEWTQVVGRRVRTTEPAPDIDAYRVAMVAGGPDLAVTAAAATLYRTGVLGTGKRRRLEVRGGLRAGGDAIERDVFDAVRRRPGITRGELCRDLRDSASVGSVTAELERVGLLADPARVTVLRRSVGILGGLLIALGVVRIVAGALANRPVAFLVMIVLAVSFATSRLLRHTPYATAAGRDLLRRLRENRRGRAHAAESAMNMALFGAGAIWLADPGTA
ncbi:MAG: hypothetical protein QOD61_2498, partial [Solirubrobacteraceae bacterium]|nr:hypothetical protein [Solirubrobacteraceae bacterium]